MKRTKNDQTVHFDPKYTNELWPNGRRIVRSNYGVQRNDEKYQKSDQVSTRKTLEL